jgi:hypothetical protein
MEDKKAKMEELKTEIETKMGTFMTDNKCPQTYTCSIGHDTYSSAESRLQCISMSDEILPPVKCFYEKFEEVEEDGEGKLKKNKGYSLVRMDNKLLRCRSPKVDSGQTLYNTDELLEEHKKTGLSIFLDLTTFNKTNPHDCLPCGASGYVP